jgi:hypothetical protein
MLSETVNRTCAGVKLAYTEDTFGYLRPSIELIGQPQLLRERMKSDGYLYLPGFLGRSRALEIRERILGKLRAEGVLDPERPLLEGRLRPGVDLKWRPDLAEKDSVLEDLLFRGRIVEFLTAYFEEEVLHFNRIWFRAMSRGNGTKPHCDFPYMGRGTFELFTAWVPYGDVPLDVGGLMLLEGSHRITPEKCRRYLERDVDAFCTNKPWGQLKEDGWSFDGTLSNNARTLREKFGGRWLTAEYGPGDLLLFGMGMVHASLDNRTDTIRLSSDTRYQRASEPADDRWVGPDPVGHGPGAKRGLIC